MPELPEVETVRRSVAPLIVGRRVLAARLRRRDILVAPGDPYGGFSRQRSKPGRPKRLSPTDMLAGATIMRVERRGKQLAIIARGTGDNGHRPREFALGVQLGMTGSLRFHPRAEPLPRTHVHATWSFEHGTLTFRDPRRFGGLRVFRSLDDLESHWSALGPDALTISAASLAGQLAGSRRAIKAALLDQGAIAGVGNIYADESLFAARIHPTRRADRLGPDEVRRLAAAIRSVLRRSVTAGGTTLSDYTDAEGNPGSYQDAHAVYGRASQPCTACRSPLAAAVLAQRATVWCPRCQPLRASGFAHAEGHPPC